jgi:hypothetical protein
MPRSQLLSGWMLAVFQGILGGAVLAMFAIPARAGDDPQPRAPGGVYELRTYTTTPGKLPVLVLRFGTTNVRLFRAHGIKLVGAWTPTDEGEAEKLVYLCWFPDRAAADKAWKAFLDDPEWKATYEQEGVTYGRVVAKAESVFLAATDYSPDPETLTGKPEVGMPGHIYELRTYIASPDRLKNLNQRFREVTMKLFSKHGMTNVVYGVPTDADKGSANTLIYFMRHESRSAADASWKAFSDDPEWKAAYAASQPDGVPLAAKVTRLYLKPTAFSPLQ